MGLRLAVVTGAKRAVKLALLPAARLRRTAEPGLFVLIYHRVGAGMEEEMDVPVDLFARHLRYVRDRFEVVRLVEGVQRLAGGRLERDQVAITFDDGYADVHTRAWPLLRRLGIPVTLFLATGFLDGEVPAPITPGRDRRGERAGPLAWDQVREMASSGLVDVGSHSVSHPDFDRIDAGRAAHELGASRRRLVDEVGTEPAVFAYPRAIVAHRDVVGEHYRWAVGGDGGKNLPGRTDPLRVTRTPARRTDGEFFLRQRLAGIAPLEDRLYARLKGSR